MRNKLCSNNFVSRNIGFIINIKQYLTYIISVILERYDKKKIKEMKIYRVIVDNDPQPREKKYRLVLYESNLKVTKKTKLAI